MLSVRNVSVLLSLSVIAGCAVHPQQLSLKELQSTNQTDRNIAFNSMQEIEGELTLHEAIARALKYNLDQRVKLLEQSLSAGELKAGKYDMLPKLMTNAGYDWRSNYSHRWDASYDSPTTIDKSGSLPDVSVDPEHTTMDLSLSWNVLDFGASYYSAKQNANRVLIANERRRKAMHTLIQNVRKTYWRAVAAETLKERVAQTIDDAEQALMASKKLSEEKLTSPGKALRFQRSLLESLRLLESVERELAASRIELSKLIGVLPTQAFVLVEPQTELQALSVPMDILEARALVSNADLRTEFLNARIAVDDTHKAMLKLLPGISFEYGTYYDSDRYLVNDNWRSAGVSVSYNLFNLLSASSRMDVAHKQEAVAQAKRMALQMSVITQVHIAVHEFNDTKRQYRRADEIYKVDAQLEELVRGEFEGDMASEQSKISANVTTILSELRRYQAMSKFQEATGQLQSSLGLEPEIDSVDDIALADLSAKVESWLSSEISEEFVAIPTTDVMVEEGI